MNENLSVYVVVQYASESGRRTLQLLNLRQSVGKVVLVRQSRGSVFPYTDADTLLVDKYPNITGIFKWFGLHNLKKVMDRHLYFPSPTVLYVMPVQRRLEKEIRNDLDRKRDVCVITAVPPHELVLVGLYLKRKFSKINWIVDWQDLWSFDEAYFNRLSNHGRRRVKQLERRVFSTCDMNVVTNPYAKLVLQDQYKVPTSKIQAISHAYDHSDVKAISAPGKSNTGRQNGPVKIGFLGGFLKPPKVPGKAVLDVLGRVRRHGPDVVLHIVGDKYLDKVSRKPVEGLEWVTVHGRTSHHESLRIVSDCDFLLLILSDSPNTRATLHMKLPFYFVLGKPILALVPEQSVVAEIIKETGTGYIIPINEGSGARLTKVLMEYNNHGSKLLRREGVIERFSWKNISKQWLQLIDRDSNSASDRSREI